MTGYFCLKVFLVSVVAEQFAVNAQLQTPGIFSSTACETANNNGQLSAICHCKTELNFTSSLTHMCRHIDQISRCIADYLSHNESRTTFLGLLFDKERFEKSVAHICHKVRDTVTICADVKHSCDEFFFSAIRRTVDMNEEKACRISDELGLCYWKVLNRCPGRIRHMWSKLAEAYTSANCSRFTLSPHKQCFRIAKQYHPNLDRKDFRQCLEAVRTERECLETEQLHSLHHTHIWENMEFELDRYAEFQMLRCNLEKERTNKCDKDLHACGTSYRESFIRQTDMIKKGERVTVEDVCSVYHNMTSCITVAAKECPKTRIHQHALFCSVMPKSCHCPINSQGELWDHSEHSSSSSEGTPLVSSDTHKLLLISLFCFSMYIYLDLIRNC